MTKTELIEQIRQKRSFLCVGLDSDPLKMPSHIQQDAEGVLTFNKAIIDATAPYTIAYKPNAAFYEAMGWEGWRALQMTIDYIRDNYPNILTILDAKRGDIGNTSDLYARAAFEKLGADALTVAPYMGEDSVVPFLQHGGKWVVVLGLTSNKGSLDFQHLQVKGGEELYETVLSRVSTWGSEENMMFVAGATQAELFGRIRAIVPHHFLLVPGVGAQGGSLEEVCRYGLSKECGLLVNSSRGIIFAGKGTDFAEQAAKEAHKMQIQMSAILDSAGF